MDMKGIKKIYMYIIMQGMICASMLAQVILFLWIFFRKGNPIGSIRRNLWFGVHLMGGHIASFSLENIFQTSLTTDAGSQESLDYPINLLALWATFILLDLGGHNTISAFILEDDSWWIHLLTFSFHMGITTLVFSFSVIEERVSSYVLLLLIAAIFKSCERILAINRGSIRRLRRSAWKNSHGSPRCSHVNRMDIEGEPRGPNTEETLRQARQCFESHIDIYIDYTTDVNVNVNQLNGLTTEKSIELLKMELGFAYNMFYSKSVVIDKFWGPVSWFFRVTSFVLIISAGILFVCVERHQPVKIDKAITIALLAKAVALECGSFFVSLLSIDRVLVKISHPPEGKWMKLVSMITACQNYAAPCIEVGQFNLLSYSVKDRKSCGFVKSLLETFDLKESYDNCWYNEYVSLDNNQITLLFDKVKTMRTNAQQGEDDTFDLLGNKIIEMLTREMTPEVHGRKALMESSKRSFEERLLIYHVGTELYYNWKEKHPEHGNVSEEEQATKNLSDYMLYLLVVHPSLLLPVLTPELRSYRDTRAATLNFFQDRQRQERSYRDTLAAILRFSQHRQRLVRGYHDTVAAMQRVFQGRQGQENLAAILRIFQDQQRQNAERQDAEDPYEALGDQYNSFPDNSAIKEGIKVGRYLISKRNDDTGRFLCQLWLEMLCFAASQCKGQSHAKQLGNGRELFTIIWLYMIHLGISYKDIVQKAGNIFFVPTAMGRDNNDN